MKKELYYTVDYRNIENGYRDIAVYYIENNKPVLWFELDALQDDDGFNFYSDEEEIQNYLDDNGYGDDDYEMTML